MKDTVLSTALGYVDAALASTVGPVLPANAPLSANFAAFAFIDDMADEIPEYMTMSRAAFRESCVRALRDAWKLWQKLQKKSIGIPQTK
jgi:hypothetical protein